MEKTEIQLSDLQRIFVGDVPAVFYLEVILRVSLIYLLLMVSMRLMGKRMSSELSRNEMAAVVSLAAAIGVPLMSPERGILPAVIIAVVIVSYQIIIARRSAKSEKFERLTQDQMSILVLDGVLQLDNMQATRITRERLFAHLRQNKNRHLGTVKRLYIEASGSFSMISNTEPVPGLCILPDWDVEFIAELTPVPEHCVCRYCGDTEEVGAKETGSRCIHCGKADWVTAVI